MNRISKIVLALAFVGSAVGFADVKEVCAEDNNVETPIIESLEVPINESKKTTESEDGKTTAIESALTLSELFPDSALASSMVSVLGKTSVNDTITLAEIEAVTRISVSQKGIVNLEGLQHFTNVTSLIISGNQITDLSPIAPLTKITELSIEANKSLVNIDVVANFTQLASLRGSYTKIHDLTPLKDLTFLTSVVLFDVDVQDASMLGNLVNLETLHLVSAPGIDDASVLQSLPKLKILNLRYSKIVDLTVFATGFPSLTSLQLTNIYGTVGTLRVDSSFVPIASVPNPVVLIDGTPLAPKAISDGGVYDATTNTISWPGLTDADTVVNATYSTNFTLNGMNVAYSATPDWSVQSPNTVTFESNGGSDIDPLYVYVGDAIGEMTTPTKDDYVFDGWYYESTLETKQFASDIVEGDTTLYAKWVPVSRYTIMYVSEEGTTNIPVDTNTYKQGEIVTIASEVPHKEGYTFVGWKQTDVVASTFTLTEKEVNLLPSETIVMGSSDIVLTAVWTITPIVEEIEETTTPNTAVFTSTTLAYFVAIGLASGLLLIVGTKVKRKEN